MQIMWTELVKLFSEAKGRMTPARWQALRNEALLRYAQGKWDTDYSDIVAELMFDHAVKLCPTCRGRWQELRAA